MKGFKELKISNKQYFSDGNKVIVCKIYGYLEDNPENMLMSVGKSVCDPSDKFDEFKGRDIARAKAMCKLIQKAASIYNKAFDDATKEMMEYGDKLKNAYDMYNSYSSVVKESLEE